jgi:hypothetical protein
MIQFCTFWKFRTHSGEIKAACPAIGALVHVGAGRSRMALSQRRVAKSRRLFCARLAVRSSPCSPRGTAALYPKLRRQLSSASLPGRHRWRGAFSRRSRSSRSRRGAFFCTSGGRSGDRNGSRRVSSTSSAAVTSSQKSRPCAVPLEKARSSVCFNPGTRNSRHNYVSKCRPATPTIHPALPFVLL